MLTSACPYAGLWSQTDEDNSKCEDTGDGEHQVADQAACEQEAESAGAMWISFSFSNKFCFYSTSCDNPISGTVWPWKRYSWILKPDADADATPVSWTLFSGSLDLDRLANLGIISGGGDGFGISQEVSLEPTTTARALPGRISRPSGSP
jgi:hypothetical protein